LNKNNQSIGSKNIASDRRKRIFSIWRKELCNINKTRDNHFRYIGQHFDLVVLVRDSARIGSHVTKNGTEIVLIKAGSSLKGVLIFYMKSFVWFYKEQRRNPFDAILAVIGEEVTTFVFHLYAGKSVKLIFDLWDIPGSALANTGGFLKNLIRKPYQMIIPWIVRKGDMVISGVVPEGLSRIGISRDRIIESENGVLEEFGDFASNTGVVWKSVSNGIRLLYVGSIHPDRGADDLLELASRLNQDGVDFVLAMVGPIDSNVALLLDNKIIKSGLKDRVIITGEIDSTYIPTVVSGADICLCPLADIEKFRWSYPVKIYEYMQLGKPVVASDLPGIRHIIKSDENGILYDPEDRNGLYSSVARLLKVPGLRQNISRNAAMMIQDKKWPLIIRKFCDEIDDNW